MANSKTQNVPKVKNSIVTKFKMWQNSKTQNVTKLKQKLKMFFVTQQHFLSLAKKVVITQNSNCDKTQKLILIQNPFFLLQNSSYNKKKSFSKNNLIPRQQRRCSLGSVLRFSQCLCFTLSSWTHSPHFLLDTKVNPMMSMIPKRKTSVKTFAYNWTYWGNQN